MERKWKVLSSGEVRRTGYVDIYEPLRVHLSNHPAYTISLSFREVESILGTRLPRAARTERGWWRNRRSSTQASACRAAECRVTAVDLVGEEVTFRKPEVRLRHVFGEPIWDRRRIRALRRHMKITQAALANLLGISHPIVSRWESGRFFPTDQLYGRLTLIAKQAKFPLT
jgi:DNA-binding transcriptional regulator YiaG